MTRFPPPFSGGVRAAEVPLLGVTDFPGHAQGSRLSGGFKYRDQKVKMPKLSPQEATACTDRYRSKWGPTSKNRVPINLSPNSAMVNLIFNAKKLGTVRTSAEVTMVCHIRFF